MKPSGMQNVRSILTGVNVRGDERDYERGECLQPGNRLEHPEPRRLGVPAVGPENAPNASSSHRRGTSRAKVGSSGARRILISHGDGDGGLFTGILVRYLGMAASLLWR